MENEMALFEVLSFVPNRVDYENKTGNLRRLLINASRSIIY